MRRLFRDHGRAGVRVAGRGRQLDGDCRAFAGGTVGRGADAAMIRVVLPAHLRTLAKLNGDVELDVRAPVTQRAILDALEEAYPVLQGTIRDHVTKERRAFLRFFVCSEDWSLEPPDK